MFIFYIYFLLWCLYDTGLIHSEGNNTLSQSLLAITVKPKTLQQIKKTLSTRSCTRVLERKIEDYK